MNLLGCSGDNVGAIIAESVRAGYWHALVGACLFVSSLLLASQWRGWWLAGVLFAMLVVHPAWTVSAVHGDCGHIKDIASWWFTGIAVTILVTQAISIGYKQRQGRWSHPSA
jgi:hypothetical protein